MGAFWCFVSFGAWAFILEGFRFIRAWLKGLSSKTSFSACIGPGSNHDVYTPWAFLAR